MNSNLGKTSNSQRGSVASNNYEFDFGFGSGLGNNRSRPLNDQKQQGTANSFASSFSSSSSFSKPASSSWAPNKPSWTHQPAPSQPTRPVLSNPSPSIVGDILGKSWTTSAPSVSSARIGIVENNPNLFEDLVGSALGKGKSSSNVPLKNAAPASAPQPVKNPYSMGNLADSLPKTNNSMKSDSWGSFENIGSFSIGNNNSNTNKTGILGGPSLRSGSGAAASSKKDPFESLVDLGSKPAINVNVKASNSTTTNTGDDPFGAFQNASKSGTASFSSNVFPGTINNSMGPNPASGLTKDDFSIPTQDFVPQKQPSAQSVGVDPLDTLFSSSSASSAAAPTAPEGFGSQPFSEVDDWGLGSEFGGNDTCGTTDLEGLPRPPAGVTASAAMNKGLDNHKQGQYADAIKWLSWAVVLLEKAGENAASMEALSCRASCYKEVGEYKKAVADCTKVLEHDSENVSILIQRALLYESTEKYKLGAEDLRMVLKIDPGNRLARSTIHRLTKFSD